MHHELLVDSGKQGRLSLYHNVSWRRRAEDDDGAARQEEKKKNSGEVGGCSEGGQAEGCSDRGGFWDRRTCRALKENIHMFSLLRLHCFEGVTHPLTLRSTLWLSVSRYR